MIAPELFSEIERDHCFVRRQPETVVEIDAMLQVIAAQDLRCIRYGGSDPTIRRRLAEEGEAEQCDLPPVDPTSHGA